MVSALSERSDGPLLNVHISFAAGKGTLQDIMIANGAIAEKTAAKIFYELQKGMAFMHKRIIAHRCIELRSILITDRGIPKLTNFKLAIQFATRDNTFITDIEGTAEYCAPEMLVEPTSDKPLYVWCATTETFVSPIFPSLGALIHFLRTVGQSASCYS